MDALMKLYITSLDEFKLLKEWQNISQHPLLLIVEGRWNLNKRDDFERFLNLVAVSQNNSDNLVGYILITDGGDDVEEYLVDELNVPHLPFLVTRNLEYEVESKNDCLLHNIFQIRNHSLPQQFPPPLQVFISGDKSNVGKSSICLSILACLLYQGVSPSDISYIKPVTQCEAEQPITRFCKFLGIMERSIGPVVFYTGFTRAFLNRETDDTMSLLSSIQEAVNTVSYGKKFVLIDGVGYPSVGSICGVSNAEVAKALHVPVVLIGKSGVGDAIDSHNLNSTYFESKGVPVLGAIFNKLSTDPSEYYNINSCAESVKSYFRQYKQSQNIYGFMPLVDLYVNSIVVSTTPTSDTQSSSVIAGNSKESLINSRIVDENVVRNIEEALKIAGQGLNRVVQQFTEHVDINMLIKDLWLNQLNTYAVPISDVYRTRMIQVQQISKSIAIDDSENSNHIEFNNARRISSYDYSTESSSTHNNAISQAFPIIIDNLTNNAQTSLSQYLHYKSLQKQQLMMSMSKIVENRSRSHSQSSSNSYHSPQSPVISTSNKKRSREQIQEIAASSGARVGG